MIKVDTITIQDFRGIRDLTLDFKRENFAVCGPNGTGKSGIVDALEFALTGNISRLAGKGTGGITLKDHAPHVDVRNRPDKARVLLKATIVKTGRSFTIERSVKNPLAPTITPRDPETVSAVEQLALHPELSLSRRELIRYVVTTPGDRAKEVQALLRLDHVEQLRSLLQRISNACEREVAPLERERATAQEQLHLALQTPSLKVEQVLEAVNERRSTLGLPPIDALTATTSFKDGILTAAAAGPGTHVPKVQALADLKSSRESLDRLEQPEFVQACAKAADQLNTLNADAAVLTSVKRQSFLSAALEQIEAEACPLCDTPWKPDELRALVQRKLVHLEEISAKKKAAEKLLRPIIDLLGEIGDTLAVVEKYGKAFKPPVEVAAIVKYREDLDSIAQKLEAFLPLPAAIEALATIGKTPKPVLDAVATVETAVIAIPEPTKQDAARDYLIVAHERLEAFRGISLRLKRAKERAEQAKLVFDVYGKVSTGALTDIYKLVETDFSTLYRFINHTDEDGFSARLTPSIGKLGFDVDFYGRGFFPPGAYHSEGHQDGMGLCLYLALMKHLLGDAFTFAVLDDVVMSVDVGHRREVCKLLKEKFPNTQFVLTTHDEVWLRHMKTAGLISGNGFIHFRKWNVDQGPAEWDERDVWQEIDAEVEKNEVRAAAGLLRHYLEYISAEICDRLRARVEFRGDAQYQLGDLLPRAVARLRELLKEGRAAAQSWGQADRVTAIVEMEKKFSDAVAASQLEQWQINPAIHYNEWANLDAEDFKPVVTAYRTLLQSFSCAEAACQGLLYVLPERGTRELLRCSCGAINVNFNKKAS